MPKITRAVTGLAAAVLAAGMAQSRARGHPSRQVAVFTLRQLQNRPHSPGLTRKPAAPHTRPARQHQVLPGLV